MMVSNRNLLFQGSIFRFHVCFGECIYPKQPAFFFLEPRGWTLPRGRVRSRCGSLKRPGSSKRQRRHEVPSPSEVGVFSVNHVKKRFFSPKSLCELMESLEKKHQNDERFWWEIWQYQVMYDWVCCPTVMIWSIHQDLIILDTSNTMQRKFSLYTNIYPPWN